MLSMPSLMTTKEVASLLRMSHASVCAWCQHDYLKALKVESSGRKTTYRIPVEELQKKINAKIIRHDDGTYTLSFDHLTQENECIHPIDRI